MRVCKEQLLKICAQQEIPQGRADALWAELARQGRRFSFAHLCYFFGVVVIAWGAFMLFSMAASFGGTAVFGVSLAYVIALLLLGGTLWFKKRERATGGTLITLAVFLVPVMFTGLAIAFDILPHPLMGLLTAGYWKDLVFPLPQIGLILAASTALYFVRFAALVIPLLTGVWLTGLHVLGWIAHPSPSVLPTIWWGFALGGSCTVFAAAIDKRTQEPYALWVHGFGAWLLFGSLYWLYSQLLLAGPLFCLSMLAFILIAIPLDRRLYMVFGTLGLVYYFIEVSVPWLYSPLGMVSLIPAGAAFVLLGVLYHRYREQIERAILSLIPDKLRGWMPRERQP